MPGVGHLVIAQFILQSLHQVFEGILRVRVFLFRTQGSQDDFGCGQLPAVSDKVHEKLSCFPGTPGFVKELLITKANLEPAQGIDLQFFSFGSPGAM